MQETVRRPRLIVTRPEPDATAFADSARAAGLDPILSPVMTIVETGFPPSLKGVGALAFTSPNGVRALAAACGGVIDLPVYAVGEITADTARSIGFSPVFPSGGAVNQLLEDIAAAAIERAFSGAILHVAGSERAGDLVTGLNERRVSARLAALYEAKPQADLSDAAKGMFAQSRPGDCVALFSPRTARLFIDLTRAAGLLVKLRSVTAYCLSVPVAEAAQAAEWRETYISPRRTARSLLELILSINSKQRS